MKNAKTTTAELLNWYTEKFFMKLNGNLLTSTKEWAKGVNMGDKFTEKLVASILKNAIVKNGRVYAK